MAKVAWLITGFNSGFGCHMTELARGDRVAGNVRQMGTMMISRPTMASFCGLLIST